MWPARPRRQFVAVKLGDLLRKRNDHHLRAVARRAALSPTAGRLSLVSKRLKPLPADGWPNTSRRRDDQSADKSDDPPKDVLVSQHPGARTEDDDASGGNHPGASRYTAQCFIPNEQSAQSDHDQDRTDVPRHGRDCSIVTHEAAVGNHDRECRFRLFSPAAPALAKRERA